MIGEAYVSAGGRQGRVDTGNTTAYYDSVADKYDARIYPSTEDVSGGSNEMSASSFSMSGTIATGGWISSISFYLNHNVTSTVTIKKGSTTIASKGADNSGVNTLSFSKSDYSELFQAGDSFTIEFSGPTGFRIDDTNSHSGTYFSYTGESIPGSVTTWIKYQADYSAELVVVHDIPTGTFKDTISSGFFACKVADWEEGAGIDFKVINGSEDSGWIEGTYDGGNVKFPIGTFTPFTSEPTQYIVRLKPRATNPTAGYPSIYSSHVVLL